MSEPGRKLTIRMPDNPGLRSAGVGGIHIDPGGRVAKGAPVMTLVSRRSSHIVRAPRSGRVVPLVGEDDQVLSGDPLFTLHLDEEALAEANRARRALIPIDKARWNFNADSDEIEPMIRDRRARKAAGWLGRFVAAWGRPIFALALYVLACFTMLPLLRVFGPIAPGWGLILMALGALMFAWMIYFLHAPNSGGAPRLAVKLMSVSWIGLAAMAMFMRPEGHELTLAALSDRVGTLVAAAQPGEDAPASDPVAIATGPGAAPEDAAPQQGLPPASSGVSGGGVPAPVSPPSEPMVILAALPTAPDAHGVTVRAWARVTPDRVSGEVVTPTAQTDADPDIVPVLLPVSLTDPGARAPAVEAPAWDAGLERVAALGAARDANATAPAVAVLLGEAPELSPPAAGPTISPRLDPDLNGRDLPGVAVATAGVPGAPLQGADVPVPSGAWLAEAGVPVVLDGALSPPGGASQTAPQPGALAALSAPPVLVTQLSRLGGSREIDPVRAEVRLAGAEGWIDLQLDAIGPIAALDVAARRPARAELTTRSAPMLPAPAGAGAQPTPPELLEIRLAAVKGQAPALDLPEAPDAVAPAPAVAGGLEAGNPRPSPPVSVLPPAVTLAAVAAPRAPVAGPALAERELLYLYVDDPRRETQPGVGDAWAPQVSPDLAAGLRGSRIEEVRPLIQVSGWCPAAGGATEGADLREVWLNDRVRLMRVRLWLEPDAVATLETEIPVFGNAPPGFFHNQLPLMGGQPGGDLMARGVAFVRQISNRFMDPNTPTEVGGQYYASAEALVGDLTAAGCRTARINGGQGPSGALGNQVLVDLAD